MEDPAGDVEFGAEGVRRSIVQQGNRHRVTLKVRRPAKSKQSCGKARNWGAVMRKQAKVTSKVQEIWAHWESRNGKEEEEYTSGCGTGAVNR